MRVWAILNPERYIKKSIKDWSLAIYDEKGSPDKQLEPISSANNEECFIEEFSLCNKVHLDEYIKVHNKMHEKLEELAEYFGQQDSKFCVEKAEEIENLLAEARGEQNV